MPVLQSSRIKDIFAEAQYSVSAHKNLQKKLKKLHQSLPEDVFFKSFTECLRVPLMCGEKASSVERTLDFVTKFITSFITKKVRPEGENASDEEEEDELPPFVSNVFKFLCENAGDESQTVRFRICQFINKLLNGLGNDACLDDDLCDVLCERLMERLRDRTTSVRTQAVRALYRLQDPTDQSCRVTQAFIFHLSSDPSADVRGTILTNIAVSSHSVRGIIERTRDTNETVRKIAFVRIAELNIQRFSIEQRNRLLERGLKDQSEKVRKCVSNDLLRAWLDFYKGNFIAYLHALDCEHATETSTLSLETMFKSTKTGLTSAIEQIRALQGSDKLIPVEELSPENALLWKVVTKYLESHPEVADDRPIDEPHEDLVPELTPFCSYILKFFEQPLTEVEPWVLAQREYILGNLLEMCEGFDLADEMGRTNLRSMCQSLLLHTGASERVVPLLIKILVKVIPNVDDRLQFLAEVIAELQDPDPATDAGILTEPAVPEMSAEEKRQLLIKEAKIRMKLNELTEDQDEAVKAKDFNRAQQLLEECNKLKEELKAVSAPPPAAPRPPEPETIEKPATQDMRTEALVIKDKGRLQKCLCIVKEMMQPPSITSLTPTLRSLMHNFVMPSFQQGDDPVTKNMALEAMGLFCLLDIELAKQHFVYMFCFQIANDEVCETALKITFDLLHLYGLETFEVEENKNDDDEAAKKKAKKKKNLFVTDTLEDEFEEDEDDAQSQTLSTSKANTSNLIGMLTSLLGSASTSMRNLAMKGLCKLLLTCRMTSSALLSRLMVMWYSPVTDGDEDFRQPMAAFLKALSTMCPRGQEMLEQAFLPTLKTLRDAPADSPLSEVDIESVAKLFISLTRPGTNVFHKKQNTHVHNAMAVTLCNELLNQDDNYFEDGMLLRSLLQLELSLDDPVFRQDLLKLATALKQAFQVRRERALIRYVERFEKMVKDNGQEGQIAVPEVDNTAQTEQLNAVDNTVNNTAQTAQLDATPNATPDVVLKKSRANAKILKVASEDDDEEVTDVMADESSDFNRVTDTPISHTVIMESPRPGSPLLSPDSQEEVQEDVPQQGPKRRKVAEDATKNAASPKKDSEPVKAKATTKATATRRGRGVSTEEERPAAKAAAKATSEEEPKATLKKVAGKRAATRTAAKTAGKGRRVEDESTQEESSDEEETSPKAETKRTRRSLRTDSPAKKKPETESKSARAPAPAPAKRAEARTTAKTAAKTSDKGRRVEEASTDEEETSPEAETRRTRRSLRTDSPAKKKPETETKKAPAPAKKKPETESKKAPAPAKKKPETESESSPAPSKKNPMLDSDSSEVFSPENKRKKMVKVMLDTLEFAEGRPRREVKLTAKALAYKEDKSKRSPARDSSGSPKRAEASPRQEGQGRTKNDSSPMPVKRTRRSGEPEPPKKPVAKKPVAKMPVARAISTENSSSDESSDGMFSKTPPPRFSVQMAASSDEMFSKTPPPRFSVPETSSDDMFSDTPPRLSRGQKPSSPARKQASVTRGARNAEEVEPKRSTRSRESTESLPERVPRSKLRRDEVSPAQAKKPAKKEEPKAAPKAALKPASKPAASASSSEETPEESPDRRALRTKPQSQRSSSSSSSPLPASSSSENQAASKPNPKVPKGPKKVIPPSSSEDSPEPERATRRLPPRKSSTPKESPAKSSPARKVSLREAVIQRAVERVRRSGVLSSPVDSPPSTGSQSSGQDDLLQRAVERVRESLVASPDSSPSSSSTVVRKGPSSTDSSAKKPESKSAPSKKVPSRSSDSNDSPSRSTRSGASQEANKRTSRTAKESPVPAKKANAAAPQKATASATATAKSSNSPSPKRGASGAPSKSADKPKEKASLGRTSSGSSLGRTSSGGISSPSMATRSNDLVNKLRTRKRL